MAEHAEHGPLGTRDNPERLAAEIGAELENIANRLRSRGIEKPKVIASQLRALAEKIERNAPPEDGGDISGIGRGVPPSEDQGVPRGRDWPKL
ncbi:hypothetical protein HY417_04005 [Candidatus Kaiserbacteria bacterium]|nr:hypothetical protein [Candidatus Kaiserbacteria bacterium]